MLINKYGVAGVRAKNDGPLPRVMIFTDFLEDDRWRQLYNFCIDNDDAFSPASSSGSDSPIRWEMLTHSKYGFEFSRPYSISTEEFELLRENAIDEPEPIDYEKYKSNYQFQIFCVENTEIGKILEDSKIKLIEIIKSIYGNDTYWEFQNITRISPGGGMDMHCDGQFTGDGYKEFNLKTNPVTDFSSIYYINDDFDGGEIEFPALGITYKPKANSLVLFSNSWHEDSAHHVKDVTRGIRYMAQGFFASC